jgi:type I restriction enzyme S subunit
MNAETFLANFSHVANASDGVRSLRQLIMASALAGDFSLPNEDLPDYIFEQIERARSSYFVKQRRKEKPLAFRSSLLKEFRIPNGWEWVRVGQICDLQTGATPSRQRPDYFGGKIRWLVSGDINQREIFDCQGRITDAGLENSNCKVLPANSVLIALNGQGKTRATVALLRVPAACNQSLVAMIPFDEKIVSPEFIFLALRYRYFEIRDITGQDQRRGLNMGLVSELSVPLAPVTEQKRILGKVDELMALCDRLETQQQKRQKLFPILSQSSHNRFTSQPNSKNLDHVFDKIGNVSPGELRKTILNLAVRGKLVRQDLADEPAVRLLEQIKKRRAFLLQSKALSKTKACRAFTREEISQIIPGSWSWTMLGEITDIGTGSTPSRTQVSFWTNGSIPWITSGSTSNAVISKEDEFITPDAVRAHRLRIYPAGTLLVALYGQGKTRGQVAAMGIAATINQACAAVCPIDGVPSMQRYLKLLLEKQYDEVRSLSAGGAQPNLNVQKIKEVIVPLPPLAEQHRIVAKVDQLMALVDTLENQQRQRDRLADLFAQAVVASLTGTKIEEEGQKMKAPKTELISNLKLGTKPKATEDAPLAALLIKAKGELSAKSLWQQSGLSIDAFYLKLKTELAAGWIRKPDPKEAVVNIVAEVSTSRATKDYSHLL